MGRSDCINCDRPRATAEDAARYKGGEGEHLCWGGCEPIDWRERALAAEEGGERVREALEDLAAAAQAHIVAIAEADKAGVSLDSSCAVTETLFPMHKALDVAFAALTPAPERDERRELERRVVETAREYRQASDDDDRLPEMYMALCAAVDALVDYDATDGGKR